MKWPKELTPTSVGRIESDFQSYMDAAYSNIDLRPEQVDALRGLFFGGAAAAFAPLLGENLKGEEELLALFEELDSELRAHVRRLADRARALSAKGK